MADADELPPVVAALVGDDASFMEMIARDVEAAQQFKADLESALSGAGTIEVSAEVGGSDAGATGEAIGEELGAGIVEGAAPAGAEAGTEFSEAFGERVQEQAAVTAEDWAAYNEMFAPIGAESGEAFSEGFVEAVAPTPERVSELLRLGLDEEAQAMMDQLPSVVAAPAAAAGEEIGATVGQGMGAGLEGAGTARLVVAFDAMGSVLKAGGDATMAIVDQVIEQVMTGSLSAAQGIEILAGGEVRSAQSMSAAIAKLSGTWGAAAEALAQYGTVEAQAAATTAVLADAENELLGTQTELLLMTQAIAQGTDYDATAQAMKLQEVADAQASVTDATQAQIAAQTELNYAVVAGDSAFLDETVAFEGVRAAAIQLGLGLNQVADELQAGNYALTDAAAAEAQAAIKANLLTDAQRQLAAANLTLIQTYQDLAVGTEVSSAAQEAALAGVSSAQRDVTVLSGGLGTVGKDAEKAAAGLGGMSEMMGPMSMALYPLMMVLPALGDMFKSSSVDASVFTSAVTQDSGAVGDNTATTIQATLAKSNLSDISKTLGLSQSQLIEYAAGEASVQAQVAAAYDKTTASMAQQAKGTAQGGPESGREAGYDLNKLEAQKAALDAVTTAVQQAVQEDAANSAALLTAEQSTAIYNASVDALGESQLLQVQQTKMSNQATVEYGNRLLAAESSASYMSAAVGAAGVNLELQSQATEVTNEATVQYGAVVMGAYRDATMFNAAIDASYISMQEQAQTSAITSVGLLNLGNSQSNLNRELVGAEMSYTQATQGASGYSTALTSLSGTTNTLLGDEASFTTALAGLTTAVDTNGKSLDVNNSKGAANITTLTQIANAADAAAAAVYQNDIQNGNAANAYQDATAELEKEKQAFIDAADKAGMNKNEVQQLANELYQLPPSVSTTVNVNDSQAFDSLNALQNEMNSIQAKGVHVAPQEYAGHMATGGPVEAGRLYDVNESGREGFFVPPANGFIVPHDQMASLGGGGGGSYGGAGSGGGGGASPVTVHVYLDSREIAASIATEVATETRAESQQYKNHNSITGYT